MRRFTLFDGNSNNRAKVGAFYLNLNNTVSNANWNKAHDKNENRRKQNEKVSQISKRLEGISKTVEQTAAMAEQSAAASEELDGQAIVLRDNISHYQV